MTHAKYNKLHNTARITILSPIVSKMTATSLSDFPLEVKTMIFTQLLPLGPVVELDDTFEPLSIVERLAPLSQRSKGFREEVISWYERVKHHYHLTETNQFGAILYDEIVFSITIYQHDASYEDKCKCRWTRSRNYTPYNCPKWLLCSLKEMEEEDLRPIRHLRIVLIGKTRSYSFPDYQVQILKFAQDQLPALMCLVFSPMWIRQKFYSSAMG